MENIIHVDDYIIGFVGDIKKYARKHIIDLLDTHVLDTDWDADLKDWLEIFKAVEDFDVGMLLKVYPKISGDYVVKVIDMG